MAITIAVIIYIVFALLVGICGIKRRMGFTGAFVLSLIFTPVLMLVILMITGPSMAVDTKRRARTE